MGWEDEHVVNLLIDKGRDLMNKDNDAFLKAMLVATEAAETLTPRNLELEAMALFYLQAAYIYVDEDNHSQSFAIGLRMIALSEESELDIVAPISSLIALAYAGCATSAIELPSVQSEALSLIETGQKFCRQHSKKHLLYMQHEHSQLLMNSGFFAEAATKAEQLVAERKLASDDIVACELDCYQKVYAEALAYASSPQAGIAYLNGELTENQDSLKLWNTRATLHFKAADYTASLEDSGAAILLSENSETLFIHACAHMMLGEKDKSVKSLYSLCVGSPDCANYALWHSMFSSEMDRLQRFADDEEWDAQIIRFIQGGITLDTLIKRASSEENPKISMGKAYCFAGLQANQNGKHNKAEHYYELCQKHSRVMSNEYMWASAQLMQHQSSE